MSLANSRQRGFSLGELLVAMVVSSVVMTAVISLFIAESRRMSQQRELSDTWLTLRSAVEVLAYDLRQASATGGDLRNLSATSFDVRGRRGSGVVCAKKGYSYYLTDASGQFTAGDSLMAVTVQSNPVWKNLRIATATTLSPDSTCSVGTGRAVTRLTFATGTDTTNVLTGSLMQAFTWTTYNLQTSADRQWLGLNGTPVTGPLTSNGLSLTYYTSGGATTTTAASVAAVRLTLRGESKGLSSSNRARMQDTVSLRITLRN
jgi:prepilin-type N-terminal cleavage/methylation domain-containing protein